MSCLAINYVNYRWKRNPVGNNIASFYIDMLIRWTTQPNVNNGSVRTRFANTNPIAVREVNNHTHPKSAAVRSASSVMIELLANLLGKEVYFVQKSGSDERKGRPGCRTYYWAKDIGVSYQIFNPGKDDIIALIDVDMYIETLPYMLSNYVNIYMISTFQPSTVALTTGEYSFKFNENNEVEYTVSGGSKYQHKIWNYSSDVVLSVSAGFLHAYYTITAYNVDRRQISDHHQIVCLTPIKTFISPLLNMSYYIGGHIIDRLQVNQNGFIRMEIQTANGRYVSTGKAGTYCVATIPATQDESIATQSRINTVKLSVAQVKSSTNLDDLNAATILTEYHSQKVTNPSECVFPVEQSVHNYQFDPVSFDPNAKHAVIPYMNPLLDECFAPDICKSNEVRAILGRAVEIRNGLIPLTPKLVKFMEEFICGLVPDKLKGTGIPVSQDEMYLRQNRPTQKAILDRAGTSIDTVSRDSVQTFIKAETYNEIKDPRTISVIPGVSKANYTKYIYDFSDKIMKKQSWYAFGKTPLEIATRVAEICEKAQSCANTDLSRFDGRVSNVLRMVEQMAMLRFYGTQYHSELLELMQGHMDQRAFTKFNIEFQMWLIRASGSGDTADFNSLDNALMAYLTFREMGYDHGKAWASLGIYGGDDGLTPDVNSEMYVETCASVGQKLEAEVIERGKLGITFLSRQFSENVWFGSPDSCCDIWRQAIKLHTTVSLPPSITPIQKYCEKLLGYYLTDKNTPVIGELASTVKRAYPQLFPKVIGDKYLRGVANGFASFEEDVQFPNGNENSWMENYAKKTNPSFDFETFYKWLKEIVQDHTKLLTPPMCMPLKTVPITSKHDVVVNGDIIKGSKVKTDEELLSTYRDLINAEFTRMQQPMPTDLKIFTQNMNSGMTAAQIEYRQRWFTCTNALGKTVYIDRYENLYNEYEMKRALEQFDKSSLEPTPTYVQRKTKSKVVEPSYSKDEIKQEYCGEYQRGKCTRAKCKYLHALRPRKA